MLFVIRFRDRPDSHEIRQRWLASHIAWLDARRDSILVAGSLRNSPDDHPVGALWIVDADSRAAAEALFRDDPFRVNGIRESFEILHWSKAFPDRHVPV